MTTLRKILAAATIGPIVAALAACDTPAPTSATGSGQAKSIATVPQPTDVPKACTPKGGGKFTIGVVDIDEETAFFTQMNAGIKTVAKKAGAEVKMVSGNDDSATQVNGIQNLTSSGVDAIVVDPYDPTALIPALKAAKKAGIPVVSADGMVSDKSAIDTQIGTANTEGGKQLGQMFLKQGGKGQTVGIVGALNSVIQIQRQKGFTDTVKAGGAKIGPVVDGHNVNDKAQTAAENLLTGNPDLKYIYATGSPAVGGAIAAVKSQSRQSSTSILGWDLDQTSADGLKSGFVKAVVQQNTYGFGYAAASSAIKLACKSGTVPSTISVPITIVTKNNLAKYEYYLKDAS